MDSLEDFLDFNFIHGSPPAPADFLWSNQSGSTEIEFSGGGAVDSQNNTRKRGRTNSCSEAGTKACREKMRRERLNERFCDLSSVLKPWRPVKTDKLAILDDAIRVLKQLETEAQGLKETNEKLLEEIKCSKVEKNDLREEKLVLKADKERIERQLKDFSVSPAGFMAPNVAAFQAGVKKMAVFPNYGYIPMWQCLPPATRDTSQDHELRPPAA
ncbi:transcription factor bHLH104-like [Gastrolobium bilobum]|uniref:transcription factor bHLH104-like n=1 Tax=Gastrolobium bilobum TaxID=150636 RepID=UPI002AAF6DB0|nr:transcription factor bHLH104-like [Gastrolobium bilobum]